MSYITVVQEARFRIGDVSEGTCIKMWWREVDETTNNVTFVAACGPDDGSGRCELCWKQTADRSGQMILEYTCDDVNCLGAKKKKAAGATSGDEGCVLQYSLDGTDFVDVTPDAPAPGQNCYFRCLCCEGKPKKPVKKQPKKKAARKK
jgi:hypothetical protein